MLKAIKLRPAGLNDSAHLLRWRNQWSARRHFFNSEKVPRADHNRWLKKKLSDPKTLIFVVEAGGKSVGQVRLEKIRGRRAEISITLDTRARGKGTGRLALHAAALLAKRKGLRGLVAHIKPGNPASLGAFVKSGFTLRGKKKIQKQSCYALEMPL